MPRERITLKKLAGILDLDVSSVSLALRNSPKISPATKKRIFKLAEEYNYSPNIAARQLRSSVSPLVGLFLPLAMNSLTNPMAGKTIQCLAEQCAARGIIFQILSSVNLTNPSAGGSMTGLLPEAFFVWGDVPRQIVESSPLCRRQVIILDPNHLSYAGYSGRCVSVDNFSGGTIIARHFLKLKVRQLLLVQGRSDHLGHKARLEGAERKWLKQKPRPSLTRCSASELKDDKLLKFVRQEKGAIFCSNDWGALQVWHRLRRLGVRMPEDVRLAGFDGEEVALLAGITTVIFDHHALAKTALDMMAQLIQDSDEGNSLPVSISIPVFLHKGQTT